MIAIKNIRKEYNGVTALNDVSLEISKGEIFGLIGPDGAGKSSLFRIMTSLLLPTSGSINVFGHDVEKDYKVIRKITGYMPERFSLYPDLSIIENLEFFATVFGTTIADNYDLIKDIYVQIEPFKKRRAGKLSGGMKQKLALSCALIHSPEFLVLDEPTTGVDAVSRKEFWELLKSLKTKGITIIVSTPYMDEAGLCDRVALIQNGDIMSVDRPEKIIKNHDKQIYSVRSDNTYKLLIDLRSYSRTYHAYAFGSDVHYTPKDNQANIGELDRYLQQAGHKQIEINPIMPGIEDVFIDLMHKQ